MILPSILGENFGNIENTIDYLEKNNVKAIHFDVMDNHFVPNLSFGPKFISDLRNRSNLIFDVHLMIENPLENARLYIDAGANILTSHIEAFQNEEDVLKMFDLCMNNQVQFGLSIKPKTSVNSITPFLQKLDLALIMTVEPGFAGQSFMEEMIPKIQDLHKLALRNNHTFIIEVDGGVSRENLPILLKSGARYFVMGTAFFKEPNPSLLINDFLNLRKGILENDKNKETL